ncbi:MAG: tyrosine-type recombinase/integrase [Defluviitaleaceae bacterium]|nr:tyrosine-type recombinase/integrase [Defluviitaleaceae bacterium]
MSSNYHEEVKRDIITKLRQLIGELPEFCEEFFLGISERTSVRTRMGYALDLKIFFAFLCENIRKFKGKDADSFTVADLSAIEALDIRKYLEYVTYYTRSISTAKDKELVLDAENDEHGKARKLSAVRTMFAYFYKAEKIGRNPAELVEFPKLHAKNITYLQADEVAKLLDEVETGSKLQGHAKAFHTLNKLRDVAIVSLFLGTGMRISELVGINAEHIDFDTSGIAIMRKGGKQDIVFFGEEVGRALRDYLALRETIEPADGHDGALFLSTQRKRIGVRAVQILVKKYAKLVTPLKKITPHKLRSTYGTSLYNETGDIYLVADVLGHNDVNTTRKHYANMPMERRRKAADVVKLRD